VKRLVRVVVVSSMAAVVVGALAAPALASATGAAPSRVSLGGPGHYLHRGSHGEADVNVCSTAVGPGVAHCDVHVRTDLFGKDVEPLRRGPNPAGSPIKNSTLGNAGAYDPAFLQSAYDAPSATNGSGQTVAIVDAYDAPHIEADLAMYRARFQLPACTTVNGCFKKVDQNGGTQYPAGNTNWAEETSLDVQMVSALCPRCHILLVEANTATIDDLGAAVKKAVELGANVVSNSYGAAEWSAEAGADSMYFDHPGVAIVASSGDSGYGVSYPAASPDVVAVGGTSLYQATYSGTRNATETAWSKAGSGCSAYEPKPAWQTDTQCANRTVADVSAVADPNTGVWVFDSDAGGWIVVGGTSVAAPIVGAMYALAGNVPSTTEMGSLPYATPSALNDVTSGSNGSCGGSYLCTGAAGYDGPTGLGTPNGAAAFAAGGVVNAPSSPSDPPLSTPTPDFSISAMAVGAMRPGATAKSTVTLTPTYSFAGTVKLSAPTTPRTGLSRRFDSSTVAVNGAVRTTTLTLKASRGGKYTVTVTATTGAVVRKAVLTVTVNDFSLTATRSRATVRPGRQVRYTLNVTPVGAFKGPVTLSVSGLSGRDIVVYGRNPVSGFGSQSITITTSVFDARKTFSVRIKGVSGALDHTVTVVLTVQ
jgi:subtilase family serine protease